MGFIGSHIVEALVKDGAHVRILDNFSTGSWGNLQVPTSAVEVLEADIRDETACVSACSGVDTVFHLAAYISVPGSVNEPVNSSSINIGGMLNMLNAARNRGVRRFVFSSSSAVYGDTAVLPTPETVLPRPTSPYGIEKLYGEHICRVFNELHGLETVALRYFNVYGPGQNPQSEYAAVIPKFIAMLLADAEPTIFGDGAQTRDFLFVGDVVQANLLAASADGVCGEVFNIAGGKATSLNDLFTALCAAIGMSAMVHHGPERAGDIKHSSADITRAQKLLGFRPEFDLAKGLERAVAFYNAQQHAA
jgi:UDP-N-acetylglucosamine 4-epimerase